MKGKGLFVLLFATLFFGGVAEAQVDDDEIIVYGDRFKRWDKTRWSVVAEVRFPSSYTFRKFENYEMRVSAYQLRVVLACEKDWKLSRGKWEVSCKIENLGLQAVAAEEEGVRGTHVDNCSAADGGSQFLGRLRRTLLVGNPSGADHIKASVPWRGQEHAV